MQKNAGICRGGSGEAVMSSIICSFKLRELEAMKHALQKSSKEKEETAPKDAEQEKKIAEKIQRIINEEKEIWNRGYRS